MFPTQFDIFDLKNSVYSRIRTNSGSRERIVYEGYYTDDGRLELREVGKENIYDYIQSFRDSVDINVILKRYNNGEVDVLSKVQGIYGDFISVPSSYAEMLNRVIAGETAFYDLPIDVRAKFNHNFAEFVQSIGSSEFFEKLGYKAADFVSNDNNLENKVVSDDLKGGVVNG